MQAANCLFTVKPDYNIEKFESNTKPKAAIGTRGYNGLETIKQFDESWNDLSQHINLVSDPYVAGKKPIQVYIFDSEEVKEYFGLIGALNFCILIPCWESKDVKLTLKYYVNYQLKRRGIHRT
ncbi:hypothetical protein LEP1GSC170_0891 [Leptospira interrogans serovar Bataviae str. HAI135]|nr:hypothetical protein LEP1GSC170_0891 [Leptospira interrogans serovar Bataviae str. HAI135]